MHSRSRCAREEKEKGETVKGEGKERKEMKGVRLACSDPYVFIRPGNMATAVQAWPRTCFSPSTKTTIDMERLATEQRKDDDSPSEGRYQSTVFQLATSTLYLESRPPRSSKVSRTKQRFVEIHGSFADDGDPRILGGRINTGLHGFSGSVAILKY